MKARPICNTKIQHAHRPPKPQVLTATGSHLTVRYKAQSINQSTIQFISRKEYTYKHDCIYKKIKSTEKKQNMAIGVPV